MAVSAQRELRAAPDQTDGRADDPVHWQRRRTLLAKERTYNSWVRTGLSAEAAGLAIAKWLNTDTGWISSALGGLLVLIGAAMFVLAFKSYRSALHELSHGGAPSRLIDWLTGALTLGALLALGLIAFWL